MTHFSNLDEKTADQVLREASVLRQQQVGSLSNTDIDNIRMGKQDQSLGFDDARYALVNAEKVIPAAESWLKQSAGT